jgi:hypothetical protein
MNWLKAKSETLQEYHIDTSNCRKLSDGDIIQHFELSNNLWSLMKDDKRISFWTNEALIEFINWFEPSDDMDVAK